MLRGLIAQRLCGLPGWANIRNAHDQLDFLKTLVTIPSGPE